MEVAVSPAHKVVKKVAAKKSILVVDDAEVNLKLMKSILEDAGFRVFLAKSGNAALKEIDRQPSIDLIVADVMMPKMDGYKLTKTLKENPETRLIPIILVTALRDTSDRVRGIEAGCDDFISKPFDETVVLSRVNSLLKIGYYRLALDEKEKFKQVIFQIENGIIVTDHQLKIINYNPTACTYLMVTDNLYSKNFLDILEAAFKISYSGDLRKDIFDRNISIDLERPETSELRPLILELKTNIIRNPLDEITSFVFMFEDVTEKRVESFRQSTFLNFVSHKFRTPLTIVLNSLIPVKDELFGSLTDHQKNFLEVAVDKTKELDRLVNKLIDFTKLAGENPQLDKTHIRLKGFLEPVINEQIKEVSEKPVDLSVRLVDEDVSVLVNATQFELVIKNIIENAILFNDSEKIKIDVDVRYKGEFIEISIADNGRGIPPEEKARIFEKFYQIDKYYAGNVRGPGMGLAIVKQAVKQNNGAIDVESNVGTGSCFILILRGQARPVP